MGGCVCVRRGQDEEGADEDDFMVSTPRKGLERIVKNLFPPPRKPLRVKRVEEEQRLLEIQKAREVRACT
jgi:hypothetical protein